MSHDDDELDEALRAELRGLAPRDPDDGRGSADLRRAIRLDVDAVVQRRQARRARWRFLAPVLGMGVASAAALTLYLTSHEPAVAPLAETPGAADAAGVQAAEPPSLLAAAPLDDEGDDLLESFDPHAAPTTADDLGADELAGALVDDLDLDDEPGIDDVVDLSELDDLDPATLARVADALKGS